MAVKCVGAYDVEVLRFTKVDACGAPIFGPCSTLVIDCFETIAINADIDEGDPINPINANGNSCFYVPGKKRDNGYEIVATLNKKYPALFTALNPNWLQSIDELGNIVGYQHIPQVSQNVGVAIEGWERVPSSTSTCASGAEEFNYFLIPRVVNFARGDMELGDKVHQEEWTGHTIAGNAWGTGPYNVRKAADTGTPGKLLAALDTRTAFYDEVVNLAPPTATCECIPLSNPAAPAIVESSCTGSTVGITATATGGRPMSINWGDGSAPAVITSGTPLTHAYTNPNTYTVSVKYTNLGQEEGYKVVTVPCP